MKPNNAGKNMWLRAQTTNRKLKQNAQVQEVDGMQYFFFVKYDTVRGYNSTKMLLVEELWALRAPSSQRFR